MRIAIGCDHVGFPLKASLIEALEEDAHAVLDLGTHGPDPVDYPAMARAVATAITKGFVDSGVLLCETGIGGSIAANKFPDIRAAACQDRRAARESRERLNVNVLCFGAASVNGDDATAVVREWLSVDFAGDEHDRREIDKIAEMEASLRQRPRHAPAAARPLASPAPSTVPSEAVATEVPAAAPPPAEARQVVDITPVLKFVAAVKDADVKAMATRVLEVLRNRFPNAAGTPTSDGFTFAIGDQHVATVTLGKNFLQLEAGPHHIPTSRIRDVEALDFALRLPSIESALSTIAA